ncbi:uncharacterized protein N7496_005500 [Penicillium cataractarum]|uniref:Brl1/Brr6 domain-containing protein n=1 Tax=Penicillium cataractarum TaxID=2100454 RepID=A0A9W9SGA7_9EURO|nr:uncharacterized protein N7496_005500 [Penicillium cataractarum]KAJ5378091.1 hypothetical protein N7496_005500 [Penicillium cataractarum]
MMESRTESGGVIPMDYEWHGGSAGPVDFTSPFSQVRKQQQDNKKRSHQIFDSPEKPTIPALRPPNSQSSFLFSPQRQQQQSALPSQSSVFGQPAFTTPRKLEVDFSSGAENLSSPEVADNEETPEQQSKGTRRNSLFNIYGRFAPSPGRGEIPRTNHFSNAVARRIHKRRRRDKALGKRMRVDDEYDDDESDRPSSREGPPTRTGKQEKTPDLQKAPSNMSFFKQLLTLLEEHPNVPAILSWWAQLVVNLSLFSLAVWMVFSFVSEIRNEFDAVASKEMDSILHNIAECMQRYEDNKCAAGNLVPGLVPICAADRKCMDTDPTHVRRAMLSARTMAQIIDSFIEPISWKAIIIFLATIGTVAWASNWSFRSFRNNRLNQGYPQHDYPPPPSYNPNLHGQPLHLQQNPAYGFYGQQDPRASPTKNYTEREDAPLMIENTRSMDFVTERSRERETHLRTPSPSKRMHRQFA